MLHKYLNPSVTWTTCLRQHIPRHIQPQIFVLCYIKYILISSLTHTLQCVHACINRDWEEGDCGSVGITSIIGSCFSSVSGDSDESDESSIHIHHLLVTASKHVDHQVEACTTPGTSLPGPAVEENVVRTTSRSSSRIPRLAHRVENSLANASIAISKSNGI